MATPLPHFPLMIISLGTLAWHIPSFVSFPFNSYDFPSLLPSCIVPPLFSAPVNGDQCPISFQNSFSRMSGKLKTVCVFGWLCGTWYFLVLTCTNNYSSSNECMSRIYPDDCTIMRLEPVTIPTAIKQIVMAIFIDSFFKLVSIVNCSFKWKYIKIVTGIGNTYINYSGECCNEKKHKLVALGKALILGNSRGGIIE